MKVRNLFYSIGFILIFLFLGSSGQKVFAETNGTNNLEVGIKYQSHVQNIGWEQSWATDSQISGTTGKSYRVEAIKISVVNPLPNMKIKYQVHVQNKGWMDWVTSSQQAGTVGESLRVEAIKIMIEGAPGYHIQYQAHVQNKGWMHWVQDGVLAGTTGQSLRIEAIKIRITNDNFKVADNAQIKYQANVQDRGWQDWSSDGLTAGTEGQSLQVEALNIVPLNVPSGMKIKYRTLVHNIGWRNWVYGGQVSGTVGQNLPLEGVEIELENQPSGYIIQYQVHVQNKGWLNWVQDGQLAGTTDPSLRIEAIKIRIVNENLKVANDAQLKYQANVQGIGWQDWSSDGLTAGTEGQSLQIEALNIVPLNVPSGMKVKYRTLIHNIGWRNWVYGGQVSGTVGQNLAIEGVEIELENQPSGYSIQYQVHVQNKGWMDWVHDGQTAGVAGLRVEAIRIKLIKTTDNSDKYTYENYSVNGTLQNYCDLEYATAPVYGNSSVKATKDQILYYINPDNFKTTDFILQFMRIDSYQNTITVTDLNTFLADKGVFKNQGQAFLDAASANNINVMYLVAHALWETGLGTSKLANGVLVSFVDGKAVTPKIAYNMFGIGAYDGNANVYGAEAGYVRGWFTVKDAIAGGAQWISRYYIHSSTYNQNTLFKMRWNLSTGNMWHQYATDVNWAYGICSLEKGMINFNKGAVFCIDLPEYK